MAEMQTTVAQEGDLVLLVSPDRKRFLVRLKAGDTWHTHKGYIAHDALIGQPLGRTVPTQAGHRFMVLEPSLEDLVRLLKRTTQIMYPKDISYILLKMNITPGKRVVEAGTGSGGLTLVLASMVRPAGRVYSYEAREDVRNLAEKNLGGLGLSAYVDFRVRDITEGFDESGVDACFLDVRTPWLYLDQAARALKGGGFFGSILPTTNQVSRLLMELEGRSLVFPEVEEILVRPYKVAPTHLRPMDRMIAHTGYLVFARKVSPEETASPRGDEDGGQRGDDVTGAEISEDAVEQPDVATDEVIR
jgi:tRNA (adenine57-N1/adenine58-N1)-methyltransferase catalytic subunit